MKGGLTSSGDGETGDQKRQRGRRPPLDDISVTEGKMKTQRREGRVKGRR